MTEIVLIRHGETDWNAMGIIQGGTDTVLNKKGRQQARECGIHLSNKHWDHLITSPLCRARDTAVIISSFFGVNVKVMDEFAEKDYGEAVGFLLENQEKYEAYGEPANLFNIRVMKGIKLITDNSRNGRILVVTHGDVIQAIVMNLFSLNAISGNFPIKNGSETIIELSNNHWFLHTLNNTNHLS